MTRMLDVLESFLALHGHSYMRLDGTTKPEQRQLLTHRFNTNPKVCIEYTDGMDGCNFPCISVCNRLFSFVGWCVSFAQIWRVNDLI